MTATLPVSSRRSIFVTDPTSGVDAPLSPAAQPVAGSTRKTWLPSFGDLVFLGCLCVALAAGGRMVSADGDPSRHLAVGEYILSTRAIPSVDVFSHTMAGQHFVPYEWLSEVMSALAYRAAGWAGTALLHGAAIGASFALLYRQIRNRNVPVLIAFCVTGLGIMASTLHWLARPHVFTFLGTATFSFILDGWWSGRLSRRWLWALVPTMALWANAHGGFLIGLILLATYAGADLLRWLAAGDQAARQRLAQLLPPAAGVLLATVLNPAGLRLLGHVTGYLSKDLLVNRTQEYMSPDFHQGNAKAFLAMLLVTLGALAWTRRRPLLHEVFLLAGFTYFALFSARNIPLFVLVVAPILATSIQSLDVAGAFRGRAARWAGVTTEWIARRNCVYGRMEARTRAGVWPAIIVASTLAVAIFQHRQRDAALAVTVDPKLQPVAAVEYLKTNVPQGNGFNELIWGGYLLHELWPAQRVFIDGQTDFYGEALAREYLDVVELHANWQDVLAAHDVRWVLYGTDSALVRALRATPGWRVAYQDTQATILTRGAA